MIKTSEREGKNETRGTKETITLKKGGETAEQDPKNINRKHERRTGRKY